MREWKLAQEQSPRDGFLELDWAPGTMQADYGAFTATVAGERLELKLSSRRSRIRTSASASR